MQFPDYMDFFAANYSPDFVEVIASIEGSLAVVNYTNHIDIIDAIFQKEGTVTIRELCDDAIEVLRVHVADCLHMQGFTLNNHEEDPLPVVAKILRGVTILATRSLVDILEGDKVDDAEDDLEWVCNVLSIVTELPVVGILPYVAEVDQHVVDLLKAGENTEDFQPTVSKESQERFLKELGEDKVGPVVDAVRSMNYFGWNPDTMLRLVDDVLETMTDADAIRRQIRLILMGSSMRDPIKMKEWAEEAAEHLYTNPQLVMRINAKWGDFI